MNEVRYTEIETGVEVVVVAHGKWEPHPVYVTITYPSGRMYAMPDSEVSKYFTIVSPQEIFINAFGGADDRPTSNQAKLAVQPAADPLPVVTLP